MTLRKYVLGVAAALMLSAAAVSPAQAEPGFASIELTRVDGWVQAGPDYWAMRQNTPGSFAVDITSQAGHDEQGLSVFISFPTDNLEVTGYEGDDWTCWDVNEGLGAEGIRCTQPHLIVHGEAWPTLEVYTLTIRDHTDSIDVYAETDGHQAHATQPYSVSSPL
ncbi:hypothetical protein ACIA8G_26100 [Lentzea sp. NPDC051213]|uniref:hypothetical protein n=1 Tax=Lentzea sp. NPDC051213 TaxID=3364126 RepID=UPI0037B637B4